MKEKVIDPENVHGILNKNILADGYSMVFDLRKSSGAYIHDSLNNCSYLDFFTFFASSPIGYNHPRMTEPDFMKKLAEVSVNKPVNSDMYTVELAEFVNTFSSIAMPDYMKYLFFISGGALAVENALKAAMDWKVRKNFARNFDRELGHKVIHFRNAFHGRSGYTLSLTNTFDSRKTDYFAKFSWPRITNPKITFPLNRDNEQKVIALETTAVNEIMSALENDGDDICALIIEPIQGEGGDNHYRPEFIRRLSEICNNNDILLIMDEVQTGMGLTGKMWAHQHFDVKPDIIVFGKKTQVCGIMAGDRIDDVKNHVFVESSRINSTFGGNLVDMVREQRYLEIIAGERLVKNAEKMGKYLLTNLSRISDAFPGYMSNVRGKGLMCAFDFMDTENRNKLVKQIYKNYMIVLPCGNNSIRFRPPLNIETDEIDKGMDILEKSINEITLQA